MKKGLYFILIAAFSCENQRKAPVESLAPAEANDIWTTYEGRVPLNDDTNLYIELSIQPADQFGEGSYELTESIEAENSLQKTPSFKGKYSTLLGETPEERLLQFHNSAHEKGFDRTYITHGFKGNVTDSRLRMLRTEPFRTTDLTVKGSGLNKLIVLDESLNAVSLERDHNLVKRTSRLFTVEGYFRHNGDSADFFEINTGESWAVSKYGDYRKAISQYHQLTQMKFQVTNMKAVGFSIRHIDRSGREVDALVIKKVLQMTTTTTPETF
jgi:hypothetical protein